MRWKLVNRPAGFKELSSNYESSESQKFATRQEMLLRASKKASHYQKIVLKMVKITDTSYDFNHKELPYNGSDKQTVVTCSSSAFLFT
jgi:hypothetical protein